VLYCRACCYDYFFPLRSFFLKREHTASTMDVGDFRRALLCAISGSTNVIPCFFRVLMLFLDDGVVVHGAVHGGHNNDWHF